MARHNDTGKAGEMMAAAWLAARGYTLLERNWRSGKHEVDIIAAKGRKLHLIEVKTRSSRSVNHPEAKVSRQKMKNLIAAAEAYQYANPAWKYLQFDILAITLVTGGADEYFLIEDVYV
jgi:putative endonuclease